MEKRDRGARVPSSALISPTLMLTGRSAAHVYAQPAAELKRLTEAGAIIKVARGYYAAVPVGVQASDWAPSMEDLSAGLASAVFSPGQGVLWGLSAARVHGALPRAIAAGYAFGPTQHRPIVLTARAGVVTFRKRNLDHLDLEYLATQLGPGLVTSVAQTILDLASPDPSGQQDAHQEAVLNLMQRVNETELAQLARRARGQRALMRARNLAAHAL